MRYICPWLGDIADIVGLYLLLYTTSTLVGPCTEVSQGDLGSGYDPERETYRSQPQQIYLMFHSHSVYIYYCTRTIPG